MKNIYSKIFMIVTFLQYFSLSYATNFYEDEFEVMSYQNRKAPNKESLFNKQIKLKSAALSFLEFIREQIPHIFPLISDPEEIQLKKRMFVVADNIPTEIWVHIASYLYYPTSRLHEVNHYFFETVTSYPVIALLQNLDYLQTLDVDNSERTKIAEINYKKVR